jgi:hypothetical protein
MRHASLLAALLALAIVPTVVAAQSASHSVWGPFDPAARHALAAHLPAPKATTSVCGSPPAPVVHLAMEGFYADPSSSIVDERKMAAYRGAVKPIEVFETGIARASDRFVGAGDQDGARCALAWMVRGRTHAQCSMRRPARVAMSGSGDSLPSPRLPKDS